MSRWETLGVTLLPLGWGWGHRARGLANLSPFKLVTPSIDLFTCCGAHDDRHQWQAKDAVSAASFTNHSFSAHTFCRPRRTRLCDCCVVRRPWYCNNDAIRGYEVGVCNSNGALWGEKRVT